MQAFAFNAGTSRELFGNEIGNGSLFHAPAAGNAGHVGPPDAAGLLSRPSAGLTPPGVGGLEPH
jgi:hypothetical protein